MIGGIRFCLPTNMRTSCQIALKRKPEQRGLYQWIGLSLLQHVAPYVHRSRGMIPYVFLGLYLSCCLYCALCAPWVPFLPPPLPLLIFCAQSQHFSSPSLPCCPPFHYSAFITSLSSVKKTPIVPDNFQDGTLTPKTLWLANIVWVLLRVKLLKGQQIKPCCLFISYVSIRLCVVTVEMIWDGEGKVILSYYINLKLKV